MRGNQAAKHNHEVVEHNASTTPTIHSTPNPKDTQQKRRSHDRPYLYSRITNYFFTGITTRLFNLAPFALAAFTRTT